MTSSPVQITAPTDFATSQRPLHHQFPRSPTLAAVATTSSNGPFDLRYGRRGTRTAAEGWTRGGAVARVPGAQSGPAGVVYGGVGQSAACTPWQRAVRPSTRPSFRFQGSFIYFQQELHYVPPVLPPVFVDSELELSAAAFSILRHSSTSELPLGSLFSRNLERSEDSQVR